MVARSEMRKRWRSLGVATLLIVIVGAVVLASVAGARRSATALARFDAYSGASTLEIDTDGTTTPAQVARFARTPGVVAVASLHAYAQQVEGRPDLQIAAAIDGRLGSAVDRLRLVAGRRQNPRAPYEITISEPLAHLAHLRIGDAITADSISPAQLVDAEHGRDPGQPLGPRVTLHIIGLVRRPLDLGDRAASGGVVLLTPEFDRQYRHRIGIFTTVLRIRTLPDQAVKARVTAAAAREFGASPFYQTTDLSARTAARPARSTSSRSRSGSSPRSARSRAPSRSRSCCHARSRRPAATIPRCRRWARRARAASPSPCSRRPS